MLEDRDDWNDQKPPMHLPARSWPPNPYPHDTFYDGLHTECSAECQACAWNAARAIRQREDFGVKGPVLIEPTYNEKLWLLSQNILWEGDKRS